VATTSNELVKEILWEIPYPILSFSTQLVSGKNIISSYATRRQAASFIGVSAKATATLYISGSQTRSLNF
jgi:hypothetical protein